MEIAALVVRAAVLPLKALVPRPRLDQRAIDGEVLIRQPRLGLGHDQLKEALRDRVRQQTIPILGEHRWRPDRFIHLQAHEPPEQDVVVELLHEEALTPNRIEELQQLRPEQPLRRDRRPPHGRIQAVEVRRHLTQEPVHQRANRSQRMIGGHARVRGHVTE